jgi:hypothetical protein
LMSILTIKSIKFESRIQDPMKHSQKTKRQRKAQESHLEEGKTVRPTNGKPKKGKEKLKIKTPPETNSPNTLNANSPPKLHFIMFLLSTTRLVGVLPTLCTSLPPCQ